MPCTALTLLPLPLGSIRPTGWLRRQLEIQAAGLTGCIEECWPDLGPDSGWLGGDGESWERGPYYLDGLLPLAHLLGDATLRSRAERWVEWMLGSQREDGQFGPTSNEDWWPRMVAVKVLIQHHEATGDDRVVPFLERYFAFQRAALPTRPLQDWGSARAADNVLSVLWLHQRTGDAALLELAELLLAQGLDWGRHLTDDLITGKATRFSHATHGPNVAMGLKQPVVAAAVRGADATELTRRCFDELDRWHGQVHGVFSGDEWLAGRDARQGIETCQVVELAHSLAHVARAIPESRYSDLLERVVYNLLPASSDALMRGHQYHQQANQIAATIDERPWSYSSINASIFGLEPHFGCCTANYHQGWPKAVQSMWAADADQGTLRAVVYGPSTVRWEHPGGVLEVEQVTEYPFGDTVRLRVVDATGGGEVGLQLTVPGWAREGMRVTHRGSEVAPVPGSDVLTLRRVWQAGDEVVVRLPFSPRRVRREKQAIGVAAGPLMMVHAPGEYWYPLPGARGLGEWEVRPAGNWNLGLLAEGEHGVESWSVHLNGASRVPWSLESRGVVVTAIGNEVPSWTSRGGSTEEIPDGPVATSWVREYELVPYGTARLRITEFPSVYLTGSAHVPWETS